MRNFKESKYRLLKVNKLLVKTNLKITKIIKDKLILRI
jgi:hypothetical protein